MNYLAFSVVYFCDEGTNGGRPTMRDGKHIRSRGTVFLHPDRRKTVVIADDGGKASLVLLNAGHPAQPGTSFDHAGRRWVIRGKRHHSRVLVAEPLSEIRQ